jgi:hypothetical protein
MKQFAGVAPSLERRHSVPEVAVSNPSPRSSILQVAGHAPVAYRALTSLEQQIEAARVTYPTAARAGFEDGFRGEWRALELSSACSFNLFAYATSFVAGRLSREKPQGGE